MKLSDRGLSILKKLEGFSDKVYPDAHGFSIGYGHFLTPDEVEYYKCRGISREEAEELLKKDVKKFEDAVSSLVKVPLKQHEFDALVLFAYNVGVRAFASSTLLKLLNSGNFQKAAQEFDRWVYSMGRPSEGLKARREVEKKLFLGERIDA